MSRNYGTAKSQPKYQEKDRNAECPESCATTTFRTKNSGQKKFICPFLPHLEIRATNIQKVSRNSTNKFGVE